MDFRRLCISSCWRFNFWQHRNHKQFSEFEDSTYLDSSRDDGGHAIIGCGYDTKEGVFWFKDPGVGVTPFYKVSSQAIDSNTYFQYGRSGFGKYNSTNYYYR